MKNDWTIDQATAALSVTGLAVRMRFGWSYAMVEIYSYIRDRSKWLDEQLESHAWVRAQPKAHVPDGASYDAYLYTRYPGAQVHRRTRERITRYIQDWQLFRVPEPRAIPAPVVPTVQKPVRTSGPPQPQPLLLAAPAWSRHALSKRERGTLRAMLGGELMSPKMVVDVGVVPGEDMVTVLYRLERLGFVEHPNPHAGIGHGGGFRITDRGRHFL